MHATEHYAHDLLLAQDQSWAEARQALERLYELLRKDGLRVGMTVGPRPLSSGLRKFTRTWPGWHTLEVTDERGRLLARAERAGGDHTFRLEHRGPSGRTVASARYGDAARAANCIKTWLKGD
jgi:hypothetical protein